MKGFIIGYAICFLWIGVKTIIQLKELENKINKL